MNNKRNTEKYENMRGVHFILLLLCSDKKKMAYTEVETLELRKLNE